MNSKKKIALGMLAVMLLVQGCERHHTLKEDIKDVGQDMKNEVNKATD